MNNRILQTIKYVFFDVLSSTTAWVIFLLYRSEYILNVPFIFEKHDYINLITIVIFWIFLYFITGSYNEIFRRSRLKEIIQVFGINIFGATLIFFIVLINDLIADYTQFYESFLALFIFHFSLTALSRFILSSITAYKVHNRVIGFNTLVIGGGKKALNIVKELNAEVKSTGHLIIGFLSVHENDNYELQDELQLLGNFNQLKDVISDYKIEDVIIAIEHSEHQKIQEILNELEYTNLYIKVIPDMYDILTGRVKINSIMGTPLIEVSHKLLPSWQQIVKNAIDRIFSLLAIVLFSPFYVLCGFLVLVSSKGPIIYKQERLGINKKPFFIYKFRSMIVDAEADGPMLSSKEDKRITRWGNIMRRFRLDETPQFFNVLFGQMSFVGPRPERAYYANQIIKKAPHYEHVFKVKPGITSWGMVKYGYAENVDEMLERVKYDILYIENMSLLIDLKIMIHTVLIIFEGRGK